MAECLRDCLHQAKIISSFFIRPLFIVGLYYFDVGADIFQTYNLFCNCHYKFGSFSIAIIFLSYVTTVLYIKYRLKEQWKVALLYPSNYINSAWLFFKKSWKAVKDDEEMPTEDKEDLEFVDEVNFIEATSESVPQTCLNCIVLKQYGLGESTFSKVSNILSLTLSIISLCLAFAKRFATMKTGKVPAFLSFEMVKAVAYWVLPMVGWTTAMILVSLSDETLGILIFFLIFLHPAFTLPFGILDRTLKRLMKKTFDSLGKRSKWRKFLVRYFTMSAVHYLTIIAVAQLIMFESWEHEKHSGDITCRKVKPTFGFTQRPFNTCGCNEYNSTRYNCSALDVFCKHEEKAKEDLQDFVSNFVNAHYFLIGLVLFPLFFHLIESFCLYFPDPIPILDFVLANKECCVVSDEQDKEDMETEMEMQEQVVDTSESQDRPENSLTQWWEIGCCVLATTYLILIPFCPKLFFKFAIETQDSCTIYYCCPPRENETMTKCFINSSK